MRVGMEKSCLKELSQESLLSNRSHSSDFFRFGIAELFSFHPFTNQDASRAQILVDFRNNNPFDLFLQKNVTKAPLISGFIGEVKFCVETDGPLIEQGNIVCSLLWCEPFY
mmetsp:Transcript_1127/g.3466  ORF Transcript_1127/g.3466 Transcript_1127/m.3466 type:complete len:111 (+) Transcript_1127:1420-1752(+)